MRSGAITFLSRSGPSTCTYVALGRRSNPPTTIPWSRRSAEPGIASDAACPDLSERGGALFLRQRTQLKLDADRAPLLGLLLERRFRHSVLLEPRARQRQLKAVFRRLARGSGQ